MQLEILFARAEGDVQAERSTSKAERIADFDREGAGKFIVGYLLRHGPTPGETLVDEAKRHSFRPHDDRAFGSVFMRLSRRNQIRHAGYCERRKGHSTSGGRIWMAVL